MTERVKHLNYKLWRRAVAGEKSYFVISFARPPETNSGEFIFAACRAFSEIMEGNNIQDFFVGDKHLECNSGDAFSSNGSKWEEKFKDDSFIPNKDFPSLVSQDYNNEEFLSFSFFGSNKIVEKFFDPEGDYSHKEIDPDWYCEGSYSED